MVYYLQTWTEASNKQLKALTVAASGHGNGVGWGEGLPVFMVALSAEIEFLTMYLNYFNYKIIYERTNTLKYDPTPSCKSAMNNITYWICIKSG